MACEVKMIEISSKATAGRVHEPEPEIIDIEDEPLHESMDPTGKNRIRSLPERSRHALSLNHMNLADQVDLIRQPKRGAVDVPEHVQKTQFVAGNRNAEAERMVPRTKETNEPPLETCLQFVNLITKLPHINNKSPARKA
jgi:hypothetical protein